MEDVIANQIASYRARLACLDKPEHKAIWENQPPLILTTKVGEARALTNGLVDSAARQSAPITGNTAQKRKEEADLEAAAYRMARTVVLYATDAENRALADKYDLPQRAWTRLRDEALIQRARLLEADMEAIVAGADAATAAQYGIDAAAVTALKTEADEYETQLVTPQQAVAERKVLTESLPAQSRVVLAKFDEVEALVLRYETTPAGSAFVTAYKEAAQIIDRGHGPKPEDEEEPPAV